VAQTAVRGVDRVRLLILLLAGGLVALVVIVAAIGTALPREHTASRTAPFARPPQDVWAAITDAASKSRVPVDVLESRPPHLLVTRVRETEKMFGGTWTIAIGPTGPSTRPDGPARSGRAGCVVTITEEGWVANPIFRFMSRYVIGHHATMDDLLKQVSRKLTTDY
jgi:hypothetical protein